MTEKIDDFLNIFCMYFLAFMRNLEEELRLYSKGTSMIKFTTLYPSIVLTGIVKRFVMG